MSAPLRIEITEDAREQIASAVAWLTKNRPSAPGAVLEDLDRAFGLLSAQPALGAQARRTTVSGVRRVTLSRIGYYLYYRVAGDALQVLALWHTRRGRSPEL